MDSPGLIQIGLTLVNGQNLHLTCAACGSSPHVHSISGLSLALLISESLFGVDDRESSRLLEEFSELSDVTDFRLRAEGMEGAWSECA